MKRVKTGIIWLFSIAIALIMIQQGWAKFGADGRWARSFAEWGYPPWFRVMVGVVETGGGILLLVPRTATIASAALAVVMVGAFVTLVLDGRTLDGVTPVVYAAVLVWIAFERRSARRRAAVSPGAA